MPGITIPEPYRVGIAKLLKLEDGAMRELSAALREASPTLNLHRLTTAMSAKIRSIDTSDLDPILDAVISLSFVAATAEVQIPEFVEDVCNAVNESGIAKPRLSDNDCVAFKRHLSDLLTADVFSIGAKARALMQEHERTFCRARILTDIRPVFGPEVRESPKAVVVVHTLRISYHEGLELKDFYVALDSDDIETLRELLDRANSKAKSLESVTEAARVPTLSPSPKDVIE